MCDTRVLSADMQRPAGDNPSDPNAHARHRNPRFLPLLPPGATVPLVRTSPESPSFSATPTAYSTASNTGTASPWSLASNFQTLTFSGGYRASQRKGHQLGLGTLNLPDPYWLPRMESIDWSRWTQGIPRAHEPDLIPGSEHEFEPEDKDLQAYRREYHPAVRETTDFGTPEPTASQDECEAHAGNTVLWCFGIPATHEADEW